MSTMTRNGVAAAAAPRLNARSSRSKRPEIGSGTCEAGIECGVRAGKEQSRGNSEDRAEDCQGQGAEEASSGKDGEVFVIGQPP